MRLACRSDTDGCGCRRRPQRGRRIQYSFNETSIEELRCSIIMPSFVTLPAMGNENDDMMRSPRRLTFAWSRVTQVVQE